MWLAMFLNTGIVRNFVFVFLVDLLQVEAAKRWRFGWSQHAKLQRELQVELAGILYGFRLKPAPLEVLSGRRLPPSEGGEVLKEGHHDHLAPVR